MAARVPCPICQTPSDFFAEPLGPFCSNRCKMVDLGQWLDQSYRIPGQAGLDDPDTLEAGGGLTPPPDDEA